MLAVSTHYVLQASPLKQEVIPLVLAVYQGLPLTEPLGEGEGEMVGMRMNMTISGMVAMVMLRLMMRRRRKRNKG